MKYFTIVLVALIAACYAVDPIILNDEQRQRVRTAAATCLKQEQLTETTAQKLRAGDFSDAGDKKTQCFVNCFLEKLNFLANGEPQEAVVKQKLGAIVGDQQITAIIQQCNQLRGDDKCETAFKLYECYYKHKAGLI